MLRTAAVLLLCACDLSGGDDPNAERLAALEGRVVSLEQQLSAEPAQDPRVAELEEEVAKLQERTSGICSLYVDSLSTAPADTTHPPVPSRLDAFVTDAVVVAAIAYNTKSVMPDAPERFSYAARWAAFSEVARQGDHKLYHPQYAPWRDAILDVARRHLSSPARLNQVYVRHRAAIVDGLTEKGRAVTVRKVLEDRVIPALKAPISDAVRVQHDVTSRAHAEADAMPSELGDCQQTLWYRYRTEQGRFSDLTDEPYLLQWRMRREAEGGQALVSAWIRVFDDLVKRLPEDG